MPTLTLLIFALLSAPQAAARPDLSGAWVLDSGKATTSGAPVRAGGSGSKPPQTGTAVAPAWPTQPAAAVRPGMGRGFVSPEIEIKQTDRELTLIRKFADANEEIRYRFDGRPSSNKLPGTGGAVDNTYVYVSRWKGQKLVSTISWTGPQGKRERTETIWIDGENLKMQTSRPASSQGGEPFVTTNVFNRKR